MVDLQLRGQRADDLDEPAGDHTDRVTQPADGAHERRRAGREAHLVAHLRQHRLGQPGERLDPLVHALGEVDLAAHGPLRDRGDLHLPAGVTRQQLDDLVLDERAVDVHHQQAASAAGETARSDGDVDAEFGGVEGQSAPQRGHVGTGDIEFERGHRSAGKAADAVDVRARPGDLAGDVRDRLRPESPGEDHDVRPARGAVGVVAAALG